MSFRRISRQAPAAWSSLIFQHSGARPSSHCRLLSLDPLTRRSLSSASASDSSPDVDLRAVRELRAELEKERQREREARKRAGLDTKDIDAEEEEDFMGVGPLIQKLEKQALRDESRPERYFMFDDEPTDSDSDAEEEEEAMIKKMDLVEKKLERHKELLEKFADSETFDEAFSWMNKIDKFEEKHIRIRPEYRVIGELINRLKVAEGKDKFILQHKLNRAVRLVQCKEANDPNDPANYGVIEREDEWGGADAKLGEDSDAEKSEEDEDDVDENLNEDDEDEYDDMKEKDNILVAKINEIDQKLEQKLEELEYAFGRKGKALEEEIKDLTEERNALIEKKKTPLYRKGFDVRLINVNRTCKVTKGGQIVSYTAILACGNYQGVVGYAKAKASAVPIALQKAYEKCFQNLHYVERHEEHTIAHAIQTSYKKTKVYLWPASTRTGMKAGRTVEMILHLAGFKNVKSKVVGSRNPHNTVKAVFKALNAIETPKDMQEKLGRTVVEKYLL